MRSRALDPDLIRSFLVAVELGNFTRVGEKLGLTQQTVSAQIGRLEAIVGRQLFVRRGSSMRSTIDAEVLAVHMRQTQEIAARVDDHFSSMPIEGSVRVGMEEGYALKGLPAILAAVHRKRPRIRVFVEVGRPDQLLVRMQNGSLDLLLGTQRAGEGDDGVLWSDRLRWVGDLDGCVDAETPIPLATRPEPSTVRSIAVDALARAGRRFEVVFESDSLSSLRAAFTSGIGIGVLTDTFLSGQGSTVEGPLHLPELGRVEYFLRVRNGDDPVVRAFAELVRNVVEGVLRRKAED